MTTKGIVFRDITGMRFGRWTAIFRIGGSGSQLKWHCRCECGTERGVGLSNLRSGSSRSCGCLLKDAPVARTHGGTGTPEYRNWAGMLNRCRNPNGLDYHLYGGRGIKVCERWLDFANFLADMGKRPFSKASVDRIDPNGNYEPSNCRWATQEEQCNNTRDNKFIEYEGKKQSLSQWSRELGISVATMRYRLHRGLDAASVLRRPYAAA